MFKSTLQKNDQSISAERSGNIEGWTNQGTNVNIKNVRLVPKLRDNLLCVNKLTNEGIQVKFSKFKALIVKDGKAFATA